MPQSLLQALFPSACACCGDILVQGERQVCLECLADLAYTRYGSHDDNPAERLLAGCTHLVHATAMLHFRQGGTVQKLVHAMKFDGCSDLCVEMGRQLGMELLRAGRFDAVDVLVPVPLHWTRRLARGYNQSELLCRGIAQTFGRSLNTSALKRHRRTAKQSQQARSERGRNVEDAFRVRRPEQLEGKHILLVDDVVTTGATLASCCHALASVPGIRISIATLAIAGG
ncbi:MAG: ComF family protein [Bacteroidales bacterium]|nr:ComF family protein [Bacteroidales bacterium]